MKVRHATEKDLRQIANVHIRCFPDSFSTQLGKYRGGYLQERFYKEYLNDVPELFFVAEENENIIGFCMGYYCEKNDYMRKYFKHNLIPIVLRICGLLITGNKQAWQKVKNQFSKGGPFEVINEEMKVNVNHTGDLLSICVIPESRGNGSAQMLMDRYLQQLKQSGRDLCLLTVDVANGRGIRFYEKNGFLGYKEAAKQARTYAKKL